MQTEEKKCIGCTFNHTPPRHDGQCPMYKGDHDICVERKISCNQQGCPIPNHVEEKPQLPKNIVLTEKQKMAQYIVTQVLGMVKSQWNVVMFKNDDVNWLQYFCGICMKMPTIIVVHKQHQEFIPVLKSNKFVKAIFMIPEWNEQHAKVIADKIQHFIKQHPTK